MDGGPEPGPGRNRGSVWGRSSEPSLPARPLSAPAELSASRGAGGDPQHVLGDGQAQPVGRRDMCQRPGLQVRGSADNPCFNSCEPEDGRRSNDEMLQENDQIGRWRQMVTAPGKRAAAGHRRGRWEDRSRQGGGEGNGQLVLRFCLGRDHSDEFVLGTGLLAARVPDQAASVDIDSAWLLLGDRAAALLGFLRCPYILGAASVARGAAGTAATAAACLDRQAEAERLVASVRANAVKMGNTGEQHGGRRQADEDSLECSADNPHVIFSTQSLLIRQADCSPRHPSTRPMTTPNWNETFLPQPSSKDTQPEGGWVDQGPAYSDRG